MGMVDDNREISTINLHQEAVTLYIVGASGVTKIVPYKEPVGEGHLPYFEIWKGGFLHERLCGTGLSVVYMPPNSNE